MTAPPQIPTGVLKGTIEKRKEELETVKGAKAYSGIHVEIFAIKVWEWQRKLRNNNNNSLNAIKCSLNLRANTTMLALI